MQEPANHRICELGSTRLRLRGDLRFTPESSASDTYVLVEDPLNSRFFRLGQAEYTFVSLLDGQTTIEEALSRLSTVLPQHRLTETDAGGLCRWLIEMDLGHTAASQQAARLTSRVDELQAKQSLARWNPITFRLPLGNPDRVLGRLTELFGGLFSPVATFVGVVLMVLGVYRISSQWDQFSASAEGVFESTNWLWLTACWIVLKVLHELAHGITCKRYGGTVRETSILFVLFVPMAYVDVTSSWRFRSRWQRIHVAAAGMYCELVIAGIAALVWNTTSGDWLNHLCFNAIVMASITTLLFNLNPLMKFDGYYILSDALNMPNLYLNGQTYVRYWARRYLFGVAATLPAWPAGQRRFIGLFGAGTWAWRVFICVSLTITAATLFHGAGIVLAAAATILWLMVPAQRLLRYLVQGQTGERPNRLRFVTVTGLALSTLVVVLGVLPWPGARQAPAVIEYAPETVLRAGSNGFVREVLVEIGQQVQPGDRLVVLENPELDRTLKDLQLQIKQSQIRERQYEYQDELAARQAEAEARAALEKQLAETQQQIEQLVVTAPCAGKLSGRKLNTMLGTYLHQGDPIVSVGDESSKQLRLSISQDDLETLSKTPDREIRFDVTGLECWWGRLDQIIPRASQVLNDPALATVFGGSLPVKPIPANDQQETPAQLELLSPRFTAIASIDARMAYQLRVGQRATAAYRPFDESIGQHLYHSASRWIRRRLKK